MSKRQIEALAKEFRQEKDAVRRSHIQTVRLLLDGMASDTVAGVTGFSVRWIKKLMPRWPDEGLAGLGNKRLHNKGKEPFLEAAGRKALDELNGKLDLRCPALADQPHVLKAHTNYHWWPRNYSL